MRKLGRWRLPGVVAATIMSILSSAAPVSAAEVSALVNLQFPNDPESIAIGQDGNIFASAPLANKVLEVSRDRTNAFAFATLPGNVLGVRLDEAGNVFAAVLGAGIFEMPAA